MHQGFIDIEELNFECLYVTLNVNHQYLLAINLVFLELLENKKKEKKVQEIVIYLYLDLELKVKLIMC